MNKIKEHFHLIIIILLIIIAASAVYYFAYALPKYNQGQLDLEVQRQNDIKTQQETENELQKQKAEQEKQAIEDKEQKLNACLADAEATYNINWSRACSDIADINTKGRADCIASGLGNSFCESSWKIDRRESCSLPSVRADSVNEYHSEAKDECFKKYK